MIKTRVCFTGLFILPVLLGRGAAEVLKAEAGESVVNLSSSHSGLLQGIILIIKVHNGAVVVWGNV